MNVCLIKVDSKGFNLLDIDFGSMSANKYGRTILKKMVPDRTLYPALIMSPVRPTKKNILDPKIENIIKGCYLIKLKYDGEKFSKRWPYMRS